MKASERLAISTAATTFLALSQTKDLMNTDTPDFETSDFETPDPETPQQEALVSVPFQMPSGISMGTTVPATPSRKQRRAQATQQRKTAWKRVREDTKELGMGRTVRRSVFHKVWSEGPQND